MPRMWNAMHLRSIISSVSFEDTIINKDYLLDISSASFQKPKQGCCPTAIFKIKTQIWLLSCLHFQKPKHGCCSTRILKSPNMVVVLLAFLKENPRYGCCLAGTFKIKSLDIVVVLLEFLSNTTHVLNLHISCAKKCQGLHKIYAYLWQNIAPYKNLPK